MARLSTPRRLAGLLGVLLVPALLAGVPYAGAEEAGSDALPKGPEHPELVTVQVPDRVALDTLVDTGVDLAEEVTRSPSGLRVQALVTPEEQRSLAAAGFELGTAVATRSNATALQREREQMLAEIEAAEDAAAQAGDELRVQRAGWFRNSGNTFVEVEVWSEAGASADTVLTVSLDAGPGTQIGDGGTFTLSRFVDDGQYMFHRTDDPHPVTAAPSRMRVTSSMGGEAEAAVTEVLDGEYPNQAGGPQPWGPLATGFVDHYVDPTEATTKIESLAAEFPNLAEVVELPYESNGYRRKAQRLLGTTTGNAVVVTSRAWGHEGGNDLTIAFVDPGAPSQPLAVSTSGTAITVSLATDASGALTSTAADVVAALDAQAGDLVDAHTYRGSAGGEVVPAAPRANLSDFLSAPEYVSREPFTVKAIRIGRHRDGSKVGVLLYSQEHAREWVTPIVALETAERLLRNYASNDEIAKLVDNLDIFIIPSVNVDGAHYSIHDFALQRKNMVNYCDDANSDPNRRNSWGVDLNRNFRVGNLFQGYSGASSSCTSGVFAGPSALSEPEARNEIWLVDENPNIRFSMNTHTHGGYFMWAPGAYKSPGRVQLPRPSFGTESYFYWASDVILNRIKEHRDTTVWSSRVGPVSDVLYSAAGNSADDHYYNNDIFAWSFEAGVPLWTGSEWDSVGFTPPFAEGYEEAQEFAHGWLGILEVARMFAKDSVLPRAILDPGAGTYPAPVEVTFDLSEPADVYYTLDGSRPTLDSPQVQFAGPRQGQQPIHIDRTTTLKWFAVDPAGNVQGGYDPDGRSNNYQQATIRITG